MSKTRGRVGACLLAVLLMTPACLLAQESASPRRGVWSATLENDKWGHGKDRHYTHGTRITYSARRPSKRLLNVARRLGCSPCRSPAAVEYVFGQDMFTPAETWRDDLISDDRPYAGWLYAGVRFLSLRATADPRRVVSDAFEADVGMVGPASLARDTQRLAHELLDIEAPRGWDHQLDNEPGVVLSYTRRWRHLLSWRLFGRLELDVSPHIVGKLGNVYTYTGGGATFRLGTKLGGRTAEAPRGRAWHFFSSFEAHAVARNIFLDGNTFSDSHRVEKERAVLGLRLGFVYRTDKFQLTLARAARSKEFQAQEEGDAYGVLALSFRP